MELSTSFTPSFLSQRQKRMLTNRHSTASTNSKTSSVIQLNAQCTVNALTGAAALNSALKRMSSDDTVLIKEEHQIKTDDLQLSDSQTFAKRTHTIMPTTCLKSRYFDIYHRKYRKKRKNSCTEQQYDIGTTVHDRILDYVELLPEDQQKNCTDSFITFPYEPCIPQTEQQQKLIEERLHGMGYDALGSMKDPCWKRKN